MPCALEKVASCDLKLSHRFEQIHWNGVSGKAREKSRLKRSIVVEITPRVRTDHSGWTLQKLQKLARPENFGYVRVTGWLMFDSRHTSKDAPRATAWEVHPITDFDVCTTTKSDCDGGAGRKKLGDYQ